MMKTKLLFSILENNVLLVELDSAGITPGEKDEYI